MRLAMIITKVDSADSVYGSNIAWIRSLAQRVEHLTVIGMSVGDYQLPNNVSVFSMGKEKGAAKLIRFLNLQRVMLPLLLLRKVDGVFIHQGQIWGLLIFYAKVRCIPVILFKAHGSMPPTVKYYLPFFTAITTTTDDTFPIDTDKKIAVGQGIDTGKFVKLSSPAEPRLIVSAGRISKVKGYEVLIEALGILNKENNDPIYLKIYGEAYSNYDQSLLVKLKRKISDLNLAHTVSLEGVIANDRMPEMLNSAALYVNASTGPSALDKSVLEAMACELPVISCNPKFRPLFKDYDPLLYCPPNEAYLLAEKIEKFFTLSVTERNQIGNDLRSVVVADHDVNRLMDRVIEIFKNFSMEQS
jgi:glycosyltransferase involved in cell wall biosynthesis